MTDFDEGARGERMLVEGDEPEPLFLNARGEEIDPAADPEPEPEDELEREFREQAEADAKAARKARIRARLVGYSTSSMDWAGILLIAGGIWWKWPWLGAVVLGIELILLSVAISIGERQAAAE
jgi:hypothetical protein